MSHSTSAVRPSGETWPRFAGASGERSWCTEPNGATAATTALTVPRKSASATVRFLLWTTTISVKRPDCVKPAAFQDLVGLVRLADVRVLLVDRDLADGGADDDRGDHEGKPAEDGRLAVVRAPAAHAGGHVARRVEDRACHLPAPCAMALEYKRQAPTGGAPCRYGDQASRGRSPPACGCGCPHQDRGTVPTAGRRSLLPSSALNTRRRGQKSSVRSRRAG